MTHPKIHNAMWPGLVGKGPGGEPFIGLDEMLDLTAAAAVNRVKFDGVDLFLSDPHISIDSQKDDLQRLADKLVAHGFVAGSLVAPVWKATGGGSAMGDAEERGLFLEQVRKACRRPEGQVIRTDPSASSHPAMQRRLSIERAADGVHDASWRSSGNSMRTTTPVGSLRERFNDARVP